MSNNDQRSIARGPTVIVTGNLPRTLYLRFRRECTARDLPVMKALEVLLGELFSSLDEAEKEL